MGTALAVIIIVVAGYFVFTRIRRQLQAKEGCGCSGCSTGPCSREAGEDCSSKK